jgi:hypothetical protein
MLSCVVKALRGGDDAKVGCFDGSEEACRCFTPAFDGSRRRLPTREEALGFARGLLLLLFSVLLLLVGVTTARRSLSLFSRLHERGRLISSNDR